MQCPGGMGVVKVERMRQRPIEQRRTRRGIACRVAEHAGCTIAHAHRGYGGEQGRSDRRLAARSHDAADEVEQEKERALDHL